MIIFDKVTKRFRRTEVLKGIDLEIARGDRVALVGSNGAGKTTMIRCLLGEYNCGGSVTVDGVETKIYKTNYILRSILLNPGHHSIRFEFAPKSFVIGQWISIGTLLILLGLVVSGTVIKRKVKS